MTHAPAAAPQPDGHAREQLRLAKEPLRVLVIGTGSIGRRHVATIQAIHPAVQFALLRDGAREDDFSRSLGSSVFGGIEEALAWKPDLAVIATPSDRHHETLFPLLKHGVATLVEKPVVVTREQVDRLEQLTLADELPATQVGCVLRFLPAVRMLKQWVEEKRCGNIVRATFEAGQYLPDWRPMQNYRESYSADSRRGGGVVFDLVHELDLAVFLLGELSLLHATGTRRSHLELKCADAALITLRNSEGTLISVELDYVSRQPVRRINIVGDCSTLRLDFIARKLEQISEKGVIESHRDGFDLNEAYRAELADLIEAYKARSTTFLPLKEGLRATRLAVEANERASFDECATGPVS